MNILEKLIAGFLERSCKNYVTTIIGVISVLLYAVSQFFDVIPGEYQGYVSAGAIVLAGVALILAKDAGIKAPDLPALPGKAKMGALLILFLLGGLSAVAQSPAPKGDLQNVYAAGASYSVNGSPAVAGTALYAHLLNGAGTYAFTAVDAVPASVKPFTVTSNVGLGVGQRVYTLGKIAIYMPTAAGVSWTGTHTGWQWTGGAMAAIPLKNGCYIMPSVRFLKSSVSGGSGYQPIVGVLFGWGK